MPEAEKRTCAGCVHWVASLNEPEWGWCDHRETLHEIRTVRGRMRRNKSGLETHRDTTCPRHRPAAKAKE